ncbi:MAG: deoxyguanosinetriphosphate triphosphohydrolase [Chloroflexi bacterium]|nr:deoxyguanosinetriphosphate triphosphohydrolase [Chloroflexota bacterium]MCI0577743.1 deoxyguanosinetriphosphate triphosphohydrolase [Chloroflexota bacterium]MCI0644649.1 deoxyguanosinetriphosphate triphosphohydrolase [Chloroflexota bacterium]MCI0728033.1 deoxyguanosinetriphosphate triphosphohydrolase [Chloroflexota bacterium]
MKYQRKREDLEAIEHQIVAPYGLKSAGSRGREHPEPESATRTAFQRDRDRIIHTTAFRRLEYKTQVFVFYEGDHYRTRLTHTLEVAQLGRSIARGLGGSEDLTEAICLAHDLGHPPFGHAGEHALNQLMKDHGGFNHNTQSYRIVTLLEHRYPDFKGLNLTYETREGIIKHETEYDKSDAAAYEPEKRGSLEAQIANLADEIAYNAHDLEDGLRANLFESRDLEGLEIWQALHRQVKWDGRPFDEIVRREVIRELIGMMVTDVVETTAASLARHEVNAPEDMQQLPVNVVGYSDGMRQKIRPLKDFLYQRMYRHYRLMRMQAKAERFISEIFEAYVKEPKMLPEKTQQRLEHSSLYRIVTDYIAGMTDRYALDEWEKLFDPYRRA